MNTKKRGNKDIIIDVAADVATIRDGDGILTMILNPYSTLPPNGIPTEAWMLHDLLLIEFTRTGVRDDYLLKTSLEKYMSLKELKNKNHTYEQINKYFKFLQTIKIKYDPKNGILIKNLPSIRYGEISLYGGTCGISNKKIWFRINPDYYKLFSKFSIIPYCLDIFKIKTDKFPHAYYIMKRLQEHSYMNRGKSNKNRISIKTLIKTNPYMPNYEDIKHKGQIYQRIKKPMIANIKELKRLGILKEYTYYYCKDIPLPNEELGLSSSYSEDWGAEFSKTKTQNNKNTEKTFLDSTLYFEMADYPSFKTK
ncbi:hypothetical protein AGMMS49921_09190 [Endomicrobiia bacterium]|nr:hypothetical protein AGMMS49921_09190 [Endomicrobiia bacterium]